MPEALSYIGWSNDSNIRHRATSGGVGSTLVKYGFEKGLITKALSFEFDSSTLRYSPVLVDSFAEYKITASIYQEMDMWTFYRKNLRHEVVGEGVVLLFCLPCQTKAIRAMASRNGVKVFLVGLTCSSQQDFGATRYLLKRKGVSANEVASIKYRGDGWPSGVQITLASGGTLVVPNLDSIWTEIFHSRLFSPKRCFRCQDTLNKAADISLADPWLPEYIRGETIGKTLVSINTDAGLSFALACLRDRYVTLEPLPFARIIASQQFTIDRKAKYQRNKRLVNRFERLVSNRMYRGFVLNTGLGYRIHKRLKAAMERRLS